jgi:putative hydrolase of the HAD superfamily
MSVSQSKNSSVRSFDGSSIKGVFFDLGGTLFSYQNVGRATGPVLMEAVRRMGIDSEPKVIGKAYGTASREIGRQYAQKKFFLHSDLFRDTFKLFVEHMQVEFDEETYAWFRTQQHDLVVDNLELRADCLDTLGHLKELGLYLSIASNIDDEMLDPLVARESLHDYLHHWTSSEAAGSCKPHRKFFEVCLEKSGLERESVLFVGDSPEHDVQGAFEAGMRTVLIREDGVQPPLQAGKQTVEPDCVISALAELKELVDQ